MPLLATTAIDPAGMVGLRNALERTVAERQAALRRLAGDVDSVVAGLDELVGSARRPAGPDDAAVAGLNRALAGAAGVPAVAEAVEQAYRHRAGAATGWPVVRGWRRLRPDPLRRLHLPGPTGDQADPAESLVAATSVPDPTAAQRSALGLAIRAVADRAAADLPAAWPSVVTAAARSRLNDLPDALDRAIASTDLGLDRRPLWWRVVGAVQWLVTLAAVVGLGWLVLGYALRVLGLPALDNPMVGAGAAADPAAARRAAGRASGGGADPPGDPLGGPAGPRQARAATDGEGGRRGRRSTCSLRCGPCSPRTRRHGRR